VSKQERARRQFREQPPVFEHQPVERSDLTEGDALILRALKRELLAVSSVRRQLAQAVHQMNNGSAEGPGFKLLAESPAWSAQPKRRLTVIIPLYNHRQDVIDALRSLERSTRTDWEAVIVDDASTDGGGEAVRGWIREHPQLACLLVGHELNQGLAAARNRGVEQARTDRLLMLDADNEVRRTAMDRLMTALDLDHDASFAYGIMERFSVSGPEGLVSCVGWDPQRLRSGNYIDAFALIRRDAMEAMNGYAYDERLYGWEDYDLWVRMAEAGRHGVFVAEIIGRYRVGHSSMISQTNLSTADAYAALIEHAPRVLAGLRVPR
jgi:glycosyltransferase involved in cell wall biosynthesis